MNINTPQADLSGTKTLKVTIPKRMHLKLHSQKLLTGTTISEMVENAVQAYLGQEEGTFGEGQGEQGTS